MLVQPGGVTYGYEKASEIRTRCSKNASYTVIGAPMINFTNSSTGSVSTGQNLVF